MRRRLPDRRKRPAATAERHGVVLSRLYRPLGKPYGFLGLLLAVGAPAIRLAPNVAPGCHAVRGGEMRVEFYRPIELLQRFTASFPGALIEFRYPPHIAIVGVEAFGWLAVGTLDLDLFKLWCDCTNNTRGHLILQREDVTEATLLVVWAEARRPS